MIRISTVGAMVKWAVETTAGTRPTTGYAQLIGVQEAPEIALEQESLDASDITDEIEVDIAGRQSTGGAKTMNLIHSDSAITSWETMKTAADTALASGKALWFEYCYPKGTNSFFFTAEPGTLGTNGLSPNEVSIITAPFVVGIVDGWDTASA